MVCVSDPQSTILVVSEKGYGKRTMIDDYRVTNRGGKGIRTLNITDKTGKLIAILNVNDKDDLMNINKSGILIRMAVDDIRTMGRATQGVRLIKLGDTDEIASIARVEHVEGDGSEDATEETAIDIVEDALDEEQNIAETE
jgi:DNA gyrase subunit A